MKHTTLKPKFNSAFSLVELLVVIAVIAVIAAIAIPNIADITGGAQRASQQRTAQNLASLASAAIAAGLPAATYSGYDVAGWVAALSSDPGIQVSDANGNVLGTFRADGVPTDTAYQQFLSVNANGLLLYNPEGAAAPAP